MSNRMSVDEFQKEFEKISIKFKFKADLECYIDSIRDHLPLFYSDNFITYPDHCPHDQTRIGCRKAYTYYDGNCYNSRTRLPLEKLYLTPQQCVGRTWLFRSDFE